MQVLRRAFSRALARAGRSIAARMAIIAMTTSSSISVKAPRDSRAQRRNMVLNLPDEEPA